MFEGLVTFILIIFQKQMEENKYPYMENFQCTISHLVKRKKQIF